jgi:hypothetical protein
MAINIPIITSLEDTGIKNAKAAFGDFKTAVNNAEGGMGKFKAGSKVALDSVKANAGNLAMVAGSAIAGFAIKAIGDFQDLALAAGKFSDATGLTVEDASKFMEAAGDIGVPVDALEGAIGRLNRTIGADPDKVRDLGVDLVYLNDGSLDVNETFLNTIQRIKDIKDPAEKARVAAQLLGKGWQGMAELIELGADDLKASLDSVSDAKIIDESEVRKAKEFREAQDNLKDVMEDLALEIGETLVPALADLLEIATDFAGAEAPGGGTWFGHVIDASVIFANVIQKGPYQAFKDLYGEVDVTTESVYKYAQGIFNAESPTRDLAEEVDDLTEAVNYADTAFADLKGQLQFESAVADAKTMLNDLKEKAVEAFQGADGALAEYEQGLRDAQLRVIELAGTVKLSNSEANRLKILVDTGDLEAAIGLIEYAKAGGNTAAVDAMRFRGARAMGGPVAGGSTYLVGERGPELFTPGTSGSITPNNALGGGTSITVNVNGGDPNSIVRALQQYVRQSGPVPVNTRAM